MLIELIQVKPVFDRTLMYLDVAWFFKKRLNILYRMCKVKLDKRSIYLELDARCRQHVILSAMFKLKLKADTDMHELERMLKLFNIGYSMHPKLPEMICEVKWTADELNLTDEDFLLYN